MTKEQLKQIPHINRLIQEKREQIDRLDALINSNTVIDTDRVKSSYRKDPMRLVDKKMDIQAEIQKDLDELIALQQEALKLIREISSPTERRLMELRYISGLKWDEVAVRMHYSYRHTTKLHGKILGKLF